MSDRPEDRPEDRRRTGPLWDDGEETRQVPSQENDPEATRQVPTQRPAGEEQSSSETHRIPQGTSQSEDKETRVIRTSGAHDTRESAYPRGYFEAAEDREDRLRNMYGGIDWLASLLGFVFAAVAGAVLGAIAGVVLGPLGLSPDLSDALGTAAITGLVLLGLLIFLTYLFGGYVSGRLARFDGGRNGAMLLLWTLALALLAVLAGGILSGFLPTIISESIRGFIQNNVLSTIGNLSRLGTVGILVAVGAVLAALLGGFFGGRLGSRYHAQIDRTT